MELMKTGTTTIGLIFKDGIILAADKRSTAGYMVANKKQKKIELIKDKVAITHAGLVSDAQLLTKLIKSNIKLEELKRKDDMDVDEIANLVGAYLYQNIRKFSTVPGIVSFLVGGFDSLPRLYEVGIDGSITEYKDYTSTGSGSVYALGVLESYYKENMNEKEARELIMKAIGSALKKDIATGNGIDVLTITKSKAEWETKELSLDV